MIKRETAHLLSPDGSCMPSVLSREYLETIFEFSYDGIYVTDGNAVTIMVNRSYEIITGLHRKDMLGQSMHDLVEKQVISQSGTLASLKRGEPVTLEQIFKTGKRATVTSTPIFDEEGRAVMVVTNVRDITELYDLQRELEKSREHNLQYFSELERLRRQVGRPAKIVARDPAMREVLRVADRLADLDIPILLEGESGSGILDLARYIVSKSRRKKARFFEVNCSDHSSAALERELFGDDVGRPVDKGMRGLFELANGGTVFLEEVGELSPEAQARLAHYMQTRLINRVGSVEPIQVDVRVLASTSRDLRELVSARQFREDLYFALNVLPLHMLPLRQRKDDILPMVEELCVSLNKKYHQRVRFTQEALEALREYSWPGNLRELRSVVESAMILCNGGIVDVTDLPIQTRSRRSARVADDSPGPLNLRHMVEDMELKYIRSAYQKYGNVRDAARSLGMDPSTYVRKRKKLEGRELG